MCVLGLIFRNDQKSKHLTSRNLRSLILRISGNVPWKQFVILRWSLTAIILNGTDSKKAAQIPLLKSRNPTPETFPSLKWESEPLLSLFQLVLSLLIGLLTHLWVYVFVSVCYELTWAMSQHSGSVPGTIHEHLPSFFVFFLC